MDFFEAIQILRRRWPVIVLTIVAGIFAGFVTAPGESADDVRYAATTTLLINPQSTSVVNLDQAALLVTTGAVPESVAVELGLGSGEEARRGVSATASSETQSLRITAVRGEPDTAEALSSAFARELIQSLSSSDTEAYDRQLAGAEARVAELESRAAALRVELGPDADPEDPRVAELAAAQAELSGALAEVGRLRSEQQPRPSLIVVEEGNAEPVDAPGVSAPDGKPERAALLGLFGLALGVGAAFALDRIDTKIRNKSTAEAAWGCPVIAEIPPLPGRRQRDELVALTKPSSPFVEAYRGLRTVVALTAPTTAAKVAANGNGSGSDASRGSIILVTSPGAGEGKTTTAAHLGAMLAEVGRTVLVVSADLRRPRLHVLFDTTREPGLTELLAGDGEPPSLRELIRPTAIDRVRLLPSGAPTPNPAPLLRKANEVLVAARDHFDYVVVDTAPVLIANDATELATVADGVLVISRAGKTSIDAAKRSAEMLDRLNVNILGAVLVGATDTPTAYSYYRYRYYSESDAGPASKKVQRRRAGRGASADAEHEMADLDRT